MDIIVFILKWYIFGIIALIAITFTMNKLSSSETLHTTIEELIEIIWWSWFGVLVLMSIAIIEFFENIEIPENVRKFYEAKETDD